MSEHYPYSEFCDHIQAMLHVRGYEYISRGDEQIQIGAENGFELNSLRIMDYMQQIYGDTEAAREKGKYLILIQLYLAEHMAEFDTNDYLVRGADDSPAMVSLHLLKAIHHVFTTTPLSQLGYGPSPKSIMALADKFKAGA